MPLDLPTPAQFENYWGVTEVLQGAPEDIDPETREAWKNLVLSLAPFQLTSTHLKILEEVFPEDWKAYCAAHWGPADEQRRTAP